MKNIKLECIFQANKKPSIFSIDTAAKIFLNTLKNFKIINKSDKKIHEIVKEIPNGV